MALGLQNAEQAFGSAAEFLGLGEDASGSLVVNTEFGVSLRLLHITDETVAGLIPEDPPHFLARTPCGYTDKARIEQELREAGFTFIDIEEVQRGSDVSSAQEPAMGLCQGTPLRGEIEAHDRDGLVRATNAVASAMRERFGDGPFRAPLQALLVTAS